MLQKIKELWVNALRSGQYIQGKGALKTQNGYCCLGVLCDIYHKETGNGEWIVECMFDGNMFVINGVKANAWLPLEVMLWAGLNAINPIMKNTSISLSYYNDNGKNFNQIADLIEQNL